MLKDISERTTRYLAVSVLFVMAVMVIAALVNMRESGSLDDLDADSIQRAVNRG